MARFGDRYCFTLVRFTLVFEFQRDRFFFQLRNKLPEKSYEALSLCFCGRAPFVFVCALVSQLIFESGHDRRIVVGIELFHVLMCSDIPVIFGANRNTRTFRGLAGPSFFD